MSLSVILSLLIFAACSGGGNKLFYNKKYAYQRKEKPVLAIMPSPDERDGRIIDRVFNEVFSYNINSMKVISGTELKEELDNNLDFAILLNRAVTLRYSDTTINHVPNLYAILSDDEIIMFKRFVKDADYILFPVNYINFEQEGFLVSGIMCRLFDLDTGELIYDRAASSAMREEWMQTYEDTFLMLAFNAYKDFNKLFLKPFILKE